MSVAFDAVIAQLQTGENVSSKSWTHTPTGTPTAAMVALKKVGGDQVTGVTYGGAAMTLVNEHPTTGTGRLQQWGLANPASGAQTVEITASGSDFSVSAHSLTFTGTHLTTAACFTSPQAADGGVEAQTTTLTVTSQAGDLVVDWVFVPTFPETDKTLTEGADQTERAETYNAARGDNFAISTEPGAASVSMDYSWASSTNVDLWRYIAINIVQAAAAAGNPWYYPNQFVRPRRRDARRRRAC